MRNENWWKPLHQGTVRCCTEIIVYIRKEAAGLKDSRWSLLLLQLFPRSLSAASAETDNSKMAIFVFSFYLDSKSFWSLGHILRNLFLWNMLQSCGVYWACVNRCRKAVPANWDGAGWQEVSKYYAHLHKGPEGGCRELQACQSDLIQWQVRSWNRSSLVPSGDTCRKKRGSGPASRDLRSAGPAWSTWSPFETGWPTLWMRERLWMWSVRNLVKPLTLSYNILLEKEWLHIVWTGVI